MTEYTLHSRMRRAITCVYWEPKSRMTICSVIEALNCEATQLKYQASNLKVQTSNSDRTAPVLSRSDSKCVEEPETVPSCECNVTSAAEDRRGPVKPSQPLF